MPIPSIGVTDKIRKKLNKLLSQLPDEVSANIQITAKVMMAQVTDKLNSKASADALIPHLCFACMVELSEALENWQHENP